MPSLRLGRGPKMRAEAQVPLQLVPPVAPFLIMMSRFGRVDASRPESDHRMLQYRAQVVGSGFKKRGHTLRDGIQEHGLWCRWLHGDSTREQLVPPRRC
eukprot:2567140-Rhodomonas_salina.4